MSNPVNNELIATSDSESDTDSETDSEVEIMACKMTITPEPFTGSEEPQNFLDKFEFFSKYQKLNDEQTLSAFPMLLKGPAFDWFMALAENEKDTLNHLKTSFKTRYVSDEDTLWQNVQKVYEMKQDNTKVLDFITSVNKQAKIAGLEETAIVQAIIQGLNPAIRQYVLQMKSTTLMELVKNAKLAEASMSVGASNTSNSEDKLVALIGQLEDKVQQLSLQQAATVAALDRPSPQIRNDSHSSSRDPSRE